VRNVLPYLGASLSALAVVWSTPVFAQDQQFKDLDPKHWAYEAVTDLQQKGVLLGYPDGYFKGKRTLTRYEFAIALKRALDKIGTITGPAGPAGPAGAPGDAGPAGPPGMTPDEVNQLRRLTDEFRNELTSLGANVRDINGKLDAIAKDVADIKAQLARQIHWGGDFFVGVRTDRSRYNFADYSGAVRAASGTIAGAADVLHDLHLEPTANLGGGVTFKGDLVVSNYLSYRGYTLSTVAYALSAEKAGQPNLTEEVLPYQAQLDIPLGGAKSDTLLTVGRYKEELTPLSYWRPDLDAYFDVPQYDDGNYVQDGVRVKAKIGSLDAKVWIANFASVVDTNGFAINQPLIGSNIGPALAANFKPYGINPTGKAIAANQTMGVGLGVPLGHFAEIGVNAIYLTTNAAADATHEYASEVVYDANFKTTSLGRIKVYGEVAKSVGQDGISNSDGLSNDDNNAYTLNIGYASGPIDAKVGYNYIDPNFAAPGYWLKLGNWENPTNLEGGFLKVGYTLNKAVQLHVGGDMYEGARNRPGYLTTDDRVDRAVAGVDFKVGRRWKLSADYEGVFYNLGPNSFDGAGIYGTGTRPVEQFITLGAGVTLTQNTALKLAYQMININNVDGGSIGAGGQTSNAGVFTTQLAVHF